MLETPLPVKCPECIRQTLIIKPGDKMYCLNNGCNFGERFPTDPPVDAPHHPEDGGVYMMSVNWRVHRYYIRQLEEEVRTVREKIQAQKNEQGLLPCPFCGPGGSMVSVYEDEFNSWRVGCGRCGSHSGVRPVRDPDGRQKVIDLWNTRPQLSGS